MPRTLRTAALLTVVLASGCAFGNRNARLSYPPRDDLAPPPSQPAAAVAAPTLALSPIADQRPEPRNVVGEVRNGFGMRTADVLTADDVSLWASQALKLELERVGFRVLPSAQGAGLPIVGGELMRVHCGAYMTYEGEATLRGWVQVGGSYAVNQVYGGKGSSGVNFAATESGYEQCLAASLQDAARRLAADVQKAFAPAAAPGGTQPASAPPQS